MVQTVGQGHGQAVGLFTGRAGRAPDPHRPFFWQLCQYLVAEKFKVFGFAEKIGLVGGEQIECDLQLCPGYS
jgi:hypothetical protein